MTKSTYSFFGTCFNDTSLMKQCLTTIAQQTLLPNRIILVNSGTSSLSSFLDALFSGSDVIIDYHELPLSRVDALNKSISLINETYALRFDSRSRFSPEYSQLLVSFLENNPSKVVGVLPQIFTNSDYYFSKICSKVLQRPYTYGNPAHRLINYNGPVSSVYLGGFHSSALATTRYRTLDLVFSEDSTLCFDLRNNGWQIWQICGPKLFYQSRDSLANIIKLFFSYGTARATSVFVLRCTHGFSRYFIALAIIFALLLIVFIQGPLSLLILPAFLIFYNLFFECYGFREKNLLLPFVAIVLQISWVAGFLSFIPLFFLKSRANSGNSFSTNFLD